MPIWYKASTTLDFHRISRCKLGMSLGVAPLALGMLGGCGKPKAEQCKALAAPLEKAERARAALGEPDDDRKVSYDEILAAKKDLGTVEVSDTKLVELRDREVKTLQDLAIAEHAFDKVRVPSELDEAASRLQRVLSNHIANLTEFNAQCDTAVKIAYPSEASSASASAETTASAPATPAPKQEAWTTFHHPTLPFEAQFFGTPEVGQRKGKDSITDAAIATDDHRMFSAAYIVFPSPPTYDCKTFMDTRVGITETDHKCRRIRESQTPVNELPTLEVTLACEGTTMLQRVSCVSKPADKTLVLFEVEAIYAHDWNGDEAHRFADSAKLIGPPASK